MAALPSEEYCEESTLVCLAGRVKGPVGGLPEKCGWCLDEQSSGLLYSLCFYTCIFLVLLFPLCATIGTSTEEERLLFLPVRDTST